MSDNSGASDVIYYPFSRCINLPILKQMLLLFESISFCDPVDDEYWREHLFKKMEREDPQFIRYRDLRGAMPMLLKAGVVRKIDPTSVGMIQDEITAEAIFSDLADKNWASLAASPQKFNLPIQRDPTTAKPSWNIFRPKLPDKVLDRMDDDARLRKHIFYDGGDTSAWQLSYAAGSAIGINTHLAAAHEFGLSPVTDSFLHHQLMLLKMSRPAEGTKQKVGMTDELAELLTRQTIIKVMQKWLSEEALDGLAVEQILNFRDASRTIRRQFFTETRNQIDKQIAGATDHHVQKVVFATSDLIVKQAKAYQDEMNGLRDRLWPSLLGAFASKSGLAGLGASAILSPAHMLLGSIPALVAPAKVLLRWNVDRKKIKRKASGSVAYLSSIANRFGRSTRSA